MADGFRYRGVHIEDMHCQYVPDADARGDVMSTQTVYDEEIGGRNGGVWFATTVKPRVFDLTCVYEELALAQREEIVQWFDRRTSGELVFDDRPYASYMVRPTGKIRFEDYTGTTIEDVERHSGVFTVQLTAYEPFAKLAANYIPVAPITNPQLKWAVSRMASDLIVLMEDRMPAAPTAASRSFQMYNCGTEAADTVIRIAGSIGSGGMLITNETTGQRCKINSLTTAETTNSNKVLEITSRTGRVELKDSSSTALAFDKHDYGYITLAPSVSCMRNARMNCTAGNTEVISSGVFRPHMEGQFIYAGGAWIEIARVNNESSATLATAPQTGGMIVTPIVTMNKITITGSNINLTELEIEYTARVR